MIEDFQYTDDELRSAFYQLESRGDVAALLGVRLQFLTAVLYRDGVSTYYKTWSIKKKAGGYRTIKAPTGHLYHLQTRLNRVLQSVYVPKASTHGFVRGRSVVTNASPHVSKRLVFNLDLLDFFPTIHFGRVRGVLMAAPFNRSEQVATTLATICCVDGSLPIGGPCSPVLANMICMRLDVQLQRLARRYGAFYTRYADDLTFSTRRRVLPEALGRQVGEAVIVGEELDNTISANGFSVNLAKVRLHGPNGRHTVTGIVVNERLNVDRRYVRSVRAMLHNWDRDGLEECQRRFESTDQADRFPPDVAPPFSRVLQGKIAYLSMVRGEDDPITKRFKAQYTNLSAGRPLNEGLAEPALIVPSPTDTFTVLHLSDFHFDYASRWDADAMLRKLVDTLSSLPSVPDITVLTGDVARTGARADYEVAERWISGTLIPRLGLDPSSLFFVPGNHDVLREHAGTMVPNLRASCLRVSDHDAQIASALENPDELRLISARFKEYMRFVAAVTGDADRAALWWSSAVRKGRHIVHLAGLCSALLSFGDNEQGKLILGKYQVNRTTTESGDVNIALMHHPFAYFVDKDSQAEAALSNWADLILHGHLHKYDIRSVEGGHSAVLIAGAGSTYQGSQYDNVCHILDIGLTDRTVRVTPIRWMADQQWRVSLDLSPNHGSEIRLRDRTT